MSLDSSNVQGERSHDLREVTEPWLNVVLHTMIPIQYPNMNVGQCSTYNISWNPIGICYAQVQTCKLLFGVNK